MTRRFDTKKAALWGVAAAVLAAAFLLAPAGFGSAADEEGPVIDPSLTVDQTQCLLLSGKM